MQSTRKLFIHVGTSKTGTTSIQNSLQKYREFLKDNGFSVIHFWGNSWEMRYLRSYLLNESQRNPRFAFRVKKWGGIQGTDQKKAKKIVSKLLSECDEKKIVISWEALWDPDRCHKFCQLLENSEVVSIISYLRRQDKFFESRFQQLVKSNRANEFNIELDKVLKGLPVIKYDERLLQFQTLFPDAEMVARIFGIVVQEKDIFHDFLNVLKIDYVPEYIASKRVNVSINDIDLCILYTCSDKLKYEDYDKILSMLLKSEFHPSHSDYFLLTLEQRTQILNRYRESNKKVFEYFNVGPLSVFEKWMTIEEKYKSMDPLEFNESELLKNAIIKLAKLLSARENDT